MDLSHIKDLSLSLTTIITVLGIYTKTFNKLFLDIVKSRYNNVPGKQPLFDTIIKSIMYIFCGTEIVTLIVSLIFQGKDKILGEGFKMNMDSIIGYALAILFGGLIYIFINSFSNLTLAFINKFENRRGLSTEKIRKINKFNLYGSVFYLIICICALGVYIKSSKTNLLTSKDINAIVTIFSVTVISFTFCICSFSFKVIIEFLANNDTYIIYVEDESIYCSCYLEYEDHYLIRKNERDRYISRSKVKEIQKIRNNK